MVEPNPDGNIALAIQNHSLSPVHLEENQQLGRIEDAVILSIKGEANEEGSASVATQVKAISQNGGRQIEKIKEALRINSLQLAQEDKGPYRVLQVCDGVADVKQIDHPGADVLEKCALLMNSRIKNEVRVKGTQTCLLKTLKVSLN